MDSHFQIYDNDDNVFKKLTEKRQVDSKQEHHNSTEERHEEEAHNHHQEHKQSRVLLLELFDDRLVLACPYRANEDRSDHCCTHEHTHRVQEPAGRELDGNRMLLKTKSIVILLHLCNHSMSTQQSNTPLSSLEFVLDHSLSLLGL